MLPKVVGTNVLVPLADGSQRPYANFDYAASAPCIEPVRAAIDEALPLYSNVHRGTGYASQQTTLAYEQARDVLRRFVNAHDRDAVVLTRNTTDSMNLLAHCLPPRTTVVVFDSEHHASLLPWQRRARVIRLPIPASPADAVAAAGAALTAAAGGPALLVVTAASNVTGELWPIDRLAGIAHSRGARIAVDAAQLVPHRPLDKAWLGLDYVAFSGHKLYAPFGAGVLIGTADWLSLAEPYLHGGGASAFVTASEVAWVADAEQRHEAGTPNVLGAIAMAAACEALSSAGWSTLQSHEEWLYHRLRSGLSKVDGVRQLSMWNGDRERVGIVSFVLDGWQARPLAARLADVYGIGVREGKFCAHPLVNHLLDSTGGCDTTDGSAVRASIGLGTTTEHVDRLVGALRDLAGHSARLAA